MKIDFSELDKLEIMLKEANIPYERKDRSSAMVNHFGEQIIYPSDDDNRVADVVVGYIRYPSLGVMAMTYGAPLLEQMGLIDEAAVGDTVEGGLTAKTVFERWEKHYEEHKND